MLEKGQENFHRVLNDDGIQCCTSFGLNFRFVSIRIRFQFSAEGINFMAISNSVFLIRAIANSSSLKKKQTIQVRCLPPSSVLSCCSHFYSILVYPSMHLDMVEQDMVDRLRFFAANRLVVTLVRCDDRNALAYATPFFTHKNVISLHLGWVASLILYWFHAALEGRLNSAFDVFRVCVCVRPVQVPQFNWFSFSRYRYWFAIVIIFTD